MKKFTQTRLQRFLETASPEEIVKFWRDAGGSNTRFINLFLSPLSESYTRPVFSHSHNRINQVIVDFWCFLKFYWREYWRAHQHQKINSSVIQWRTFWRVGEPPIYSAAIASQQFNRRPDYREGK